MSSSGLTRSTKPRHDDRRATESNSSSATSDASFKSSEAWSAPRWVDPLLIAIAMIIMLIWSWGTWPDPLIDFGRELYTPWQLSQGKVLYRDVQSFYGPLSPYVNALWFKLFGVSLRMLVLCNLGIMIALIWMLHGILHHIGGRLGATAACMVFVLLFGFAQYVRIGNYNYLCPYSHEATHGIVLSIASLFLLIRFIHTGRPMFAWASGLTLGMVFLTKPESFLAAAPAVVAGLILAIWRNNCETRQRGLSIIGFGIAALIAPLTGLLLLSTAMPLGEAWRGVLGSWPYLRDSRLTSLPFFRAGMGLQNVLGNLKWLAIESGLYATVLVPPAAIGLWLKRRTFPSVHVTIIVFLAVGGLVLGLCGTHAPNMSALHVGRPLGLISVGIMLGSLIASVRAIKGRHDSGRSIAQLAVSIFASMLLVKMLLHVRIVHYGFVLAMPSTMLLVVLLLEWIPAAIDRRGGRGLVFRSAAVSAIFIVSFMFTRTMGFWWSGKTQAIGTGADQFRAFPVPGALLANIMTTVKNLPDVRSLAVLPEGVMLNYLTRLPTTVPYLTFLPSDLLMFGEDHMIEAFDRSSPDVIVIITRDTSEYGSPHFGLDYGQKVQAWIQARYHVAARLGDPDPDWRSRMAAWIIVRNAPLASAPVGQPGE